jgi:Cys-rich protein (TIGR01571 family)
MVPYLTGSFVCFILSEFYNPLFGLIPPIALLCTGIMLRLHVARMYNIRAGGPCVECMIGCCCCCCSLAQSKQIATTLQPFSFM